MGILNIIRKRVEEGLYYLTEHADAEAIDDNFDIYDIERCLLYGDIRRTWPRDKKYEILGESRDGKVIGIVCRLTMTGKVRIITVYEDKKK